MGSLSLASLQVYQALVIRVAIVEDISGIRRNMERLLKSCEDFACVAACSSGEEALEVLPAIKPDVVLMDIQLLGMSGIQCTVRLKNRMPDLQVMMITVYDDSEKVFQALRAGACGYILKRSAPDEILAALADVAKGGAPMTPEIARKVVAAFHPIDKEENQDAHLAPREREILEFLSQGFANKEIADKMDLSIETIRSYLKKIYVKLHVRCRTEAVVKYLGHAASGQAALGGKME